MPCKPRLSDEQLSELLSRRIDDEQLIQLINANVHGVEPRKRFLAQLIFPDGRTASGIEALMTRAQKIALGLVDAPDVRDVMAQVKAATVLLDESEPGLGSLDVDMGGRQLRLTFTNVDGRQLRIVVVDEPEDGAIPLSELFPVRAETQKEDAIVVDWTWNAAIAAFLPTQEDLKLMRWLEERKKQRERAALAAAAKAASSREAVHEADKRLRERLKHKPTDVDVAKESKLSVSTVRHYRLPK